MYQIFKIESNSVTKHVAAITFVIEKRKNIQRSFAIPYSTFNMVFNERCLNARGS